MKFSFSIFAAFTLGFVPVSAYLATAAQAPQLSEDRGTGRVG